MGLRSVPGCSRWVFRSVPGLVSGMFQGVPMRFMFTGVSGVFTGCSGLFWSVSGCSGVFCGVPGCSGPGRSRVSFRPPPGSLQLIYPSAVGTMMECSRPPQHGHLS